MEIKTVVVTPALSGGYAWRLFAWLRLARVMASTFVWFRLTGVMASAFVWFRLAGIMASAFVLFSGCSGLQTPADNSKSPPVSPEASAMSMPTMQTRIRMVYPAATRTVGGAVDYMLEPHSYRLAYRDGVGDAIARKTFIDNHGVAPVPLYMALQRLMGDDDQVVLDQERRIYAFQKRGLGEASVAFADLTTLEAQSTGYGDRTRNERRVTVPFGGAQPTAYANEPRNERRVTVPFEGAQPAGYADGAPNNREITAPSGRAQSAAYVGEARNERRVTVPFEGEQPAGYADGAPNDREITAPSGGAQPAAYVGEARNERRVTVPFEGEQPTGYADGAPNDREITAPSGGAQSAAHAGETPAADNHFRDDNQADNRADNRADNQADPFEFCYAIQFKSKVMLSGIIQDYFSKCGFDEVSWKLGDPGRYTDYQILHDVSIPLPRRHEDLIELLHARFGIKTEIDDDNRVYFYDEKNLL